MPANRGVLLAVLSALGSAPDGALLRQLQVEGLPDLAIIAWKFAALAVIQILFLHHRQGCDAELFRDARRWWRHICVGLAFQAGGTLSTVAMLNGRIANALFLYYASPAWSLVLGHLVLGERVTVRRVLALGIALVGVLCILGPSAVSNGTSAENGAKQPNLLADAAALLAGCCIAGYLTTCRHAAVRNHGARPAPMLMANVTRALCVSVGAFASSASSSSGPASMALTARSGAIVAADALGIAIFQIGGYLAAAHLPSADVASVQLLDLLFGPGIAFALHGEEPTGFVLAGGSMLLLALLLILREARMPLEPPPDEEGAMVELEKLPTAEEDANTNHVGGALCT